MVILKAPEHLLIRFEDRSYRWIDVKRFPWNSDGEDQALIDSLIRSRHYRDTYLSSDSHGLDVETVHGPYRVAEISPSDFVHVSCAEARATLNEFCNLYPSQPGTEMHRTVVASVLPLLQGAACYRLRPIVDAQHDWAFILMEFRELVAISREACEVALIVMAID